MSHTVDFIIPKRSLGKADVEFDVAKDGEKLGRLKVSNGSIEWVKKNDRYGYVMKWSDFDVLMQGNGRKKK